MTGLWIAHDLQDELVDFVQDWSQRTEIGYGQLLRWIELSARKFRDWRQRYGKVTEHNHQVPRDHWLEAWEKEAIVKFFASWAQWSDFDRGLGLGLVADPDLETVIGEYLDDFLGGRR